MPRGKSSDPTKSTGNKFAPGKSGNPGGRLCMPTEVRDLLKQHGPKALRRMIGLSESGDERISLYATKDILDRAYGKARESVDITQNTETVDTMDDKQVNDRILELLIKAREDRTSPPFGAGETNKGIH